MEEIKIGSYIRLIKDRTQIYKVSSLNEEIVIAYNTNKIQQTLNISEIEIGDDNDMILFDQNGVVYKESDI